MIWMILAGLAMVSMLTVGLLGSERPREQLDIIEEIPPPRTATGNAVLPPADFED